MQREPDPDVTQSNDFVNYLPAMPSTSDQSSLLERFVDRLFGRGR
ncbi:hypothetical protein [Natronobeatus ordinarius]|nr:hypothetical protein [Natronobeatus ordinarius]